MEKHNGLRELLAAFAQPDYFIIANLFKFRADSQQPKASQLYAGLGGFLP